MTETILERTNESAAAAENPQGLHGAAAAPAASSLPAMPDVLIPKPASMRGYALHRIVAQYVESIAQGASVLWVDEGSHIRVRRRDAAPPLFRQGQMLAFSLQACVARTKGNKHHYFPRQDWRSRSEWLRSRAEKNGFSILGLHVGADMERIQAHDGRVFAIDATEFTGLLTVTDPQAFGQCLVRGIGSVGRTFGKGMLVVQ